MNFPSLQRIAIGIIAIVAVSASLPRSWLPAGALFLAPAHAQASGAPVTDLTPYVGQSMALVRNTTPDAPTRIDLVIFDPASKQVKMRRPTRLDCERVHFAQQTIFCLGTPKAPGQGGPSGFRVTDLHLRDAFAGEVSNGVTVSRARVSPDGLYATSTMFVTGHAYGANVFSTEVLIIELKQRKLTLPPLEYWNIQKNNARINARDMNFWGVTFSPRSSDDFYVTASFGGKAYLAKGKISTRRIDILQEGLECPSFSPDGTHLAFKKRNGMAGWSPAVLDLATQVETVFKQPKSMDDQIEWLDNHTLVYELNTPRFAGAKTDLMQLDIRQPHAQARLWLADAGSPAIARNVTAPGKSR